MKDDQRLRLSQVQLHKKSLWMLVRAAETNGTTPELLKALKEVASELENRMNR